MLEFLFSTITTLEFISGVFSACLSIIPTAQACYLIGIAYLLDFFFLTNLDSSISTIPSFYPNIGRAFVYIFITYRNLYYNEIIVSLDNFVIVFNCYYEYL